MNILSILKQRTDSFDKKIKPLLIQIFDNSASNKWPKLRNAIIYYLLYYKIERKKKQINKLNFTNFLLKPYYIFLFMNKQIKKLLKQFETEGQYNSILNLYKEFYENNKQNTIYNAKDKEIFSEIKMKEILKLVEASFLNEYQEYCIINDTKIEKTCTTLFHHNLLYAKKQPYIIFNYDDPKRDIREKIIFAKKEYQLKGLIMNKTKSTILIKNHINSYWFSVFENKWKKSIQKYIRNNNEIIKVYYLSDSNNDYLNSCINDSYHNAKNLDLFSLYTQEEVKWLLNNALWILKNQYQLCSKKYNWSNLSKLTYFWDKKDIKKIKFCFGLKNNDK